MKKIICSLFFAFLAVGIVAANGIDVPTKVASTFKAKYPSAEDVVWDMANDHYIATFNLDGSDASSTFEKDGTWKETVTEISEDELPEEISKYLEDNYDDNNINSASKIETPSSTTFSINVEVTETDDEDEESTSTIILTFDEEGSLIED